MGNLLHREFELKIKSVRNTREHTDRYNAIIVPTGQEVSVKFANHGTNPNIYVGKTAFFDGDTNDIQDNPRMNINPERDGRDPKLLLIRLLTQKLCQNYPYLRQKYPNLG